MPQKHLFRIKPIGQAPGVDTKLLEELERLDDQVSTHFPLHLMEVPADEWFYPKEYSGRNTVYSRDFIVDHGGIICAQNILERYSEFKRIVRNAGFAGRIIYIPELSEGGCWIFGNSFILVSEKLQRYWKVEGVGKPLYLLQATFDHGHIDCDYGLIDDLGILYFRPDILPDNQTMLQKIASGSGYELRPYSMPYSENINRNGINFISGDGRLLTTYIDSDEREYLERRGLEVLEFPLEHIDSCSGLRCIYGEFGA